MSWGWVGALVGGAAAILFAPFSGGASLLSLPALFGVGALGGMGLGMAVDKVIGSVGDTPKNQLAEVGINPEKLHEEAKEYREKRKDFLEDKNKEDQKKVDDLDKKLESLDESIKNMQQEIAGMDDNDPGKAKKVAQLNNLEKQRDQTQEERDGIQKKIDGRNDKIDSIFKSLGDPVNYTTEQFNQKANTPLWKSWKNWGIGIVGMIIIFMLIGLLRKLFNSVLSNLKG